MVDAIALEIKSFEIKDPGQLIETIYFGGGTPSLLSEYELSGLIEEIHSKFNVSADAELSLEANPDDIDPHVLSAWRQAGINRLSLGIQSFSENELRWMNRAHNSKQSKQALIDITEAGFTNFSADLIYGSPLLTDEELLESVSILEDFKTPHISAYALTVEPKTRLYHDILNKRYLPVDPDKQASHFELLSNRLEETGFEHYEISNFAKPGHRSKHNTSYWLGLPYVGFGPSAHSFDGKNIRKWNISNNALYIKSIQNGLPAFEEEILTPTQQLNEYIMISLRTKEGINLNVIREKFGEKELKRINNQSEKFIDEGLLEENNNNLFLSREGRFLADGIAADLFGS